MEKEEIKRIIAGIEAIPSALLGYSVPIVWGAESVYVDLETRTIYLSEPEGDRIEDALTLIRAWVDHEAAHLRFTEVAALGDLRPGVRLILNAIEDGRINRLIGELYPGCKQNIGFADEFYIRSLVAEGDPEVLATVGLICLAQGASLREVMGRIAFNVGSARLLRIVKDITALFPQMTCTADAAAHAQAIFDRWAEERASGPPSAWQISAANGDEGASEESNIWSRPGQKTRCAPKGTGLTRASRSGRGSSPLGAGRLNRSGRSSTTWSSPGQRQRDASMWTRPDRQNPSRLAQAKARLEEVLGKTPVGLGESLVKAIANKGSVPATDPTGGARHHPGPSANPGDQVPWIDGEAATTYRAWDQDDQVVHVKPEYDPEVNILLAEARSAAGNLYRYLVDDLAQPRNDWARMQSQGQLDPLLLHRAGFDNKVFRKRLPRTKVDTAMTMLIDYSGSMSRGTESRGKIDLAIQLALLFAETAERLEISCEVLGFTAGITLEEVAPKEGYQRVLPLNHLILKDFSQSFHQARYSFLKPSDPSRMCHNVDGESLLWAAGRLAERSEKKKVLWVLSDGKPHAEHSCTEDLIDHLRSAVRTTRKQGITCIAIGIESNHVADLYENWMVVDSVADLVASGYAKIAETLRG